MCGLMLQNVLSSDLLKVTPRRRNLVLEDRRWGQCRGPNHVVRRDDPWRVFGIPSLTLSRCCPTPTSPSTQACRGFAAKLRCNCRKFPPAEPLLGMHPTPLTRSQVPFFTPSLFVQPTLPPQETGTRDNVICSKTQIPMTGSPLSPM